MPGIDPHQRIALTHWCARLCGFAPKAFPRLAQAPLRTTAAGLFVVRGTALGPRALTPARKPGRAGGLRDIARQMIVAGLGLANVNVLEKNGC